MSMVEGLFISLLVTTWIVVLPVAGIFTVKRVVDGAIFYSILGLGMSLMPIVVIKWFNLHHPNIAFISYVLITAFVILILFNLLLFWLEKDD